MMMRKKQNNTGFTLVELMVSISIFVVVMTIVMGSILSVLNMNSKAQSQKTAMDNLNFALESIARTVRFSTNYHCGATLPLTSPLDCSSGASSLTVLSPDGTSITFALTGNSITESVNGATPLSITSPEVVIQSLNFFVLGSYPYTGTCPGSSGSSDCFQPRITVTVSGYAGSVNKQQTKSSFQMETTISQRKLDV